MMDWLLVPLAYLTGSVSSAIIVCKMMGLADPRENGSGNPGATNVMRIGGKKAAAITLAGDALKGLLPVLLAKALGVDSLVLSLVVFAAFIGHLYPIFFEFKGGKGVATSLGVTLGVAWLLGLVVAGTWFVVYKLGKISSLAALVAATLTPLYAWLIVGDVNLTVTFTVISLILLWRHKSNIQRLLAGQES
ncbi:MULTISPECIES: glycerol-3-phosphate 1-O-acyltransferase PlsY [Methylomonas]|uniref:Glycerol-3-phosphate acyltransferase n=2 Tax=Methylomonas TaxID=416 RepID=A0A126T5N4_9GAMM|nr:MULTISPECIES: glycerol-3-phosphate 1-O-acyltransferase PlsY [Methylomonas]AMK77382.1 acyl-phosphate glycerol 3-phosphate acyltransferase [Methylomonas denitrificans]OAI04978.1 glycerol-3-phosphate acyltransferase [Methylomonas methanica]TCV84579.1 acyl-phosphate glycerol-3-phosphate acyltransferase [Methylomonas methanica]